MARITRKTFLVLLVLTSLAPSGIGQQPSSPDLILLNGRIFTSDLSHPYVEALAIQGDRITAAGTSEKIVSLAGPQTRRVDLTGRLVIPGINDAHYHCSVEPRSFQLQFKSMDPAWQEVVDQLSSADAKAPNGMLILGEIGPTALDDPRATKASLDKLAPHHGVMLDTWSQHAAILNSAGFTKLGVKDNQQDPLGGRLVRSVDGKLTGVVYEYAKFRLDRRRSDMATDEEALRQTQDFFGQAVRFGITSVQNMSMSPGSERCELLYEKALAPIRMRVIRMPETTPQGRDMVEGRSLPRNPTALITVSGTKWVLDGTPIESSAAMREPYSDNRSDSGWMNFSEREMEAMLRESLSNDDQLLVHIVGDRTTEIFLNAMDATGGKAVWSGRRVRIEHGDGIMPDLVSRTKELGVIVIVNPTHLALRDLFIKRFGAERTNQIQPLRSLLSVGIPVAIGSDGPNNPYLNIMLASLYPGKPQEAITREQAVTAYTLTAAYAEFAEKDKGSLEPGKLADLAVLSQDIFPVPPGELPKTESVLTLVGGKIVYDAKAVSVY
jgi:predicted amidohydrolase YtcJ